MRQHSTKPRRKPTLAASQNVKPLRLTLRDVAVLEALYTTRYLTGPQIQALFWRQNRGGQFGQRKACQRRLRHLFEHGLVRRIEPLIRYSEGKKPLIYALAQAGAQVLMVELGLDPVDLNVKPQPSAESHYPFLQHILDTNQLRIAFTNAAEAAGIQLESWRTERELKGEAVVLLLTDPLGKTQRAAVVPDAVVCLNRNGKRALFLLEVDRRTVTVTPSHWQKRGWTRKVRTYIAYFASTAYQQQYDHQCAQVLTITTSEQRATHLQEATVQAGGGHRFWFTTLDHALDPAQLLNASIWSRAGLAGQHSILR